MKNLLSKVSVSPRKRVWFCIFLALTVIVMVVIFCFSSQTATQSDKLSDSVRETGKEIVGTVLEKVENKTANNFIRFLNDAIRKVAHVVLYAALGFTLYGAAICLDPIKKFWQKAGLVILIGGFYGATDEIHQIFVAGRTSEVLDVFIDMLGVVVGVLFMLICYNFLRLIKNKVQKKRAK